MGKRGLHTGLVMGYNLVPRPAAKMIPFIANSFIVLLYFTQYVRICQGIQFSFCKIYAKANKKNPAAG